MVIFFSYPIIQQPKQATVFRTLNDLVCDKDNRKVMNDLFWETEQYYQLKECQDLGFSANKSMCTAAKLIQKHLPVANLNTIFTHYYLTKCK